jgi:Raf kinase inhibitor-like YbhB/YbcL family protein
MQITSPAFQNGEYIPVRYTCEGPNINPPLRFHDVPNGTASLVLTVEDQDATPVPWVHWLVFNLPPTTRRIDEGSIPVGGTEGHANGGTPGYEGPCPKYFQGTHRYVFRLYALDVPLDVPATATKADLQPYLESRLVAVAELLGLRDGTLT